MKFSENKSSRIKFAFITPCKQATVDSEHDRTVSLRMRMRFSYKLYVLNQNIKVQHCYQIFVFWYQGQGQCQKKKSTLKVEHYTSFLITSSGAVTLCQNTKSKNNISTTKKKQNSTQKHRHCCRKTPSLRLIIIFFKH